VPAAPAIRKRAQARRPGAIRAIAIGASTGGPRALFELLPELSARVAVPILIVQHMPPDFTRSLAESIARQTQRTVIEVTDGAALTSAQIFIAPGGRHLVVRGAPAGAIAGLSEAPPENGCRPSADVLFRSVAAVFGRDVLALILTGMGRDGTAGLQAVRRAGGYVIAQDEASSVVWGMPGSAVQAGVVDEVRPLREIAAAAGAVVNGGVSA
jgi:two-component system chemotaxis response regulator CheB